MGNDLIIGDIGDDVLYGGVGSDTLNGYAGNDTIDAGIGRAGDVDYLYDFLGSDTFVIHPGSGTVVVSEFETEQDYDPESSFSTNDRIDLRSFGNAAPTWDQLLAATSSATGIREVRFSGQVFPDRSPLMSESVSDGIRIDLTAFGDGLVYVTEDFGTLRPSELSPEDFMGSSPGSGPRTLPPGPTTPTTPGAVPLPVPNTNTTTTERGNDDDFLSGGPGNENIYGEGGDDGLSGYGGNDDLAALGPRAQRCAASAIIGSCASSTLQDRYARTSTTPSRPWTAWTSTSSCA